MVMRKRLQVKDKLLKMLLQRKEGKDAKKVFFVLLKRASISLKNK